MNVKLTKQQQEFIENTSSVVTTPNGNDYYYMPFWFKKESGDMFKMLTFDRLPYEVIDIVKEIRDTPA